MEITPSKDVTQRAAAITQWLQAISIDQVHFINLCQSLKLLRVEVWLGVLIGSFELQ